MTSLYTEAYKMFTQMKSTYGDDYLSQTDSSGDGITTKSEFKEFMKDKYGSDVSDALIEKMWSIMDTNKHGKLNGSIKNYNALDENEVRSIYENVETLNAMVAEAIAGLDTTGLDADLVKELKAAIEDAIYTAGVDCDVDTIVENLVQEYQKKQDIKNYVAEFNTSIASLPNYQALISQFPEAQDEIDALVEAYITSNYDDLKSGNTDIATLAQTFDDETVADKLEALKAEKVVTNFINRSDFYQKVLEQMGLCTTVDISELFGQKSGKGLDVSTVADQLAKQTASSDGLVSRDGLEGSLSQELVSSDSKYLLDYIQNNASTNQAIEDILNDVKANAINFVNSDGTINESKLLEYVAEKFAERINEIFVSGTIEPDEAYKLYEAQVTAIKGDGSKTASERLAGIQQAADDYILALRNAGYGDVVDEYLDGKTFTEMGAISTQIDALIEKIKAAVETIETNKANPGVITCDDFEVDANSPYYTTIAYNGSGKVEYSASAESGTVTCGLTSGQLTYNAPATEGYDVITIEVKVDGVVVATKEVNVKINNKVAAESVNKAVEDAIGSGSFESGEGDWFAGVNQADSFNNALDDLATRIGDKVDAASDKLKALGVDTAKVDAACQTLKNYYNAFIKVIKYSTDKYAAHKSTTNDENFFYTNELTGRQAWTNALYGERNWGYYENTNDAFDTVRSTVDGSSGIYVYHDTGRTTKEGSVKCYISWGTVADKLKEFLEQAGIL